MFPGDKVLVSTSQIIRFSRICMKYQCFVNECSMLVRKLLKQGYKKNMLKIYCDKLSGIYQRVYDKNSSVVKSDVFDD